VKKGRCAPLCRILVHKTCCLAELRFIFFLVVFALGANEVAAQGKYRPDIAGRLDSLVAEESYWATQVRHCRETSIADTSRVNTVRRGKAAADRHIQSVLRHILESIGYPGQQQVGSAGAESFWLLIQHADADALLQQQALDLMKIQVQTHNVPGSHYAFLADRILVNGGNLQLYGTQVRLKSDSSSFEPRPLQDPQRLDQRRAMLGLPPMAEYIDLMNRRYRERLHVRE
jgi:hypothetical protein